MGLANRQQNTTMANTVVQNVWNWIVGKSPNKMEQFVKKFYSLDDQQTKQLMTSPECAKYLQLTDGVLVTEQSSQDDKCNFDYYMAVNYKPMIATCVKYWTKHDEGYFYVNFRECVMDLFFVENEHFLLTSIGKQSILYEYFMCVKYGYICQNIKRGVVAMMLNKPYAHARCCQLSLYHDFCKNHELQRRASITVIYEETNRYHAIHNVERVFADSCIVDNILDFF